MNRGKIIKRDTAPDVIRGFALLGILVVNIQYVGLSSKGLQGYYIDSLANEVAGFLILLSSKASSTYFFHFFLVIAQVT